MYADVKQPPGPPPWRALVSTFVPFVCMSDDVNRQAPPKVVVGPLVAKPPILPISISSANEREVEERVVVIVVVAGGACAKSPDRLFVSVIAG